VSALFRNFDIAAHRLIVKEMDEKGSSCIANFLTEAQLSSLQRHVNVDAERYNGQYFSHHGGASIESSLLGVITAAPEFRAMLDGIYQIGHGKSAYSNEVFTVLRCVQGLSGRRESNCFHYDASLVTALLPIDIPDHGDDRGDLMIFPNFRRVRSNVLFNVAEKALLQNALSRKLITTAIRHHLLKPEKLQLVPGNLYLFWGYRTLHANEPCNPACRRATAVFHYGDPHAGSVATRLILKLNQRRARRATALGTQPSI
jgi:hypothetical protein